MKNQRSRLSIAVSAVLLTTLISGCSGDTPESLITSGKSFLAKHDNKAAVIQLKNALQKDPNLGEARFLLGKALMASGDIVGAEVELQKALDLKYSPDQTVPLLAQVQLAMGQATKVTDQYSRTTLSNGEPMANLKTTLSQAYAAQKKSSDAENALKAALAADPGYAPAQLVVARNLAAEQKYADARSIVDNVLAKNPKEHDALLLRGALEAAQGNLGAATEDYRKSIEAKPDFLPAHAALISTLLQEKRLDDASKQLAALKALAPKHPQTLYLEAQVSYLGKNFKGARDTMQELLKIAPNNAAGLQLAGATEFQLGSYLQAETYLNKALQQHPALSLARKMLVSTYLRTGQTAKAMEVLQPVLGKVDSDADLLALAGETYLQSGDADKAADYFAKANKLAPNDENKKTQLALAHMAQGNTANALSELEQISSADQGITADLALIAAYIRSGDIEKALAAVDSLDKKQPNNPATQNLRGRILLSKKDVTGARKSFEKALSLNPRFFPAAASLAALDMADKKPDDARKRFENILVADPKNIPAMLSLAELRAASGGSSEEVSTLINNAISANPGEVAPRLALIQYYLKVKDQKNALTAANDAVAALPDNPQIINALGLVQQISGDLNQALATYGKLATLQPASPLPQLRMAEINIASDNKGDAKKNFEKALAIQPDLIQAQRGLILLALDAKKPSEAQSIARQVQKQRPKEGVGYVLEGDIDATQKKWREAIDAYRRGLKQVETTELAAKLHTALLSAGKAAEADKLASTWLKDHPKDIGLRLHLGDLATAKKNYAEAANEYRAVLAIAPDTPLALNNLAWVSGQLKAADAIGYAQKANQLAPNQPQFMDTLAMLLADRGDTGKAIDLLHKALDIAPNAASIRLNLAKALIAAGRKKEARTELESIAKLGDKFPAQTEVSQLLQTL